LKGKKWTQSHFFGSQDNGAAQKRGTGGKKERQKPHQSLIRKGPNELGGKNDSPFKKKTSRQPKT